MNRTNNPNTPLSLDPQIDEDKVRRALGLKTNGNTTHQQRPEQARQRHRFVADGAVPVVMLNRSDSETTGLKERLASAESALENERAAHASTRRTLADAQAAHQTLQTRFGHTELSHGEALRAERDARRAAEEAAAALRLELQAAPKRRVVREAAVETAVEAEPIMADPVASEQAMPVATARPGRKPRVPAAPKEPKPVRWWTPSFRAKKG